VAAGKVFPHNLRHLFAVTYYNVEKDICHLADLLGHSNVNTTRIYTLISCEMQEQRLDGLGLVLIDTNTA
jgi:site-specific recombinase XerD